MALGYYVGNKINRDQRTPIASNSKNYKKLSLFNIGMHDCVINNDRITELVISSRSINEFNDLSLLL